jgi:hypothetical protein
MMRVDFTGVPYETVISCSDLTLHEEAARG